MEVHLNIRLRLVQHTHQRHRPQKKLQDLASGAVRQPRARTKTRPSRASCREKAARVPNRTKMCSASTSWDCTLGTLGRVAERAGRKIFIRDYGIRLGLEDEEGTREARRARRGHSALSSCTVTLPHCHLVHGGGRSLHSRRPSYQKAG